MECINATHFLPVPDNQLNEHQRETACDPTLQFVKKAILDGVPDTKDDQPAAIHQYCISLNNISFLQKKGAIIRKKVIIWGSQLSQYCSLEVVS